MAEQIVEPRIRGFMSMTAHPDGCAANVAEQAALAHANGSGSGLDEALVLGCSTGYGLGSLLTCSFGYGARCLGVCFEKPADERRTATAGWYNMVAAKAQAAAVGRAVDVINGDAFSDEIRDAVVERLKQRGARLDIVVYSLAAPRRKDPRSDTVWSSVLKPIGASYSGKTIDLRNGEVTEATIAAASPEEVEQTIKVMGGEDWRLWIERLLAEDLLAPGCRSVAYSYIGPDITYPIYRSGTIGRAKEHIEQSARDLSALLAERVGGQAWISVNKALVTQASAAIPVVPLYISVLFKIMKEQGTHENAVEQIVRLFKDHIGPGATPALDEQGRIRLDDLELAPTIQARVTRAWQEIDTGNLEELSDYAGFKSDFAKLFGFGVDGVDYGAAVETELALD